MLIRLKAAPQARSRDNPVIQVEEEQMGNSVRRSSVLIVSALLAITILSLCMSAVAQTAKDGTVTINGGRNAIFVGPPAYRTSPSNPLPAGVVTIYSNLGKGNNTYNAISGVGILGPDAGQPWPQSVGTAFTPTQDHLAQAVQVGVTYVQGTNGVIVSLNEDSNGIPGKQLAAKTFTNLPAFGSCCILQTGKGASGIPVKANTQYWIVVRPIANDTYCVWNDNYQGLQGTWANNIGQGWTSSYQVLGSMGVYGK
jgi:hypothetical protein